MDSRATEQEDGISRTSTPDNTLLASQYLDESVPTPATPEAGTNTSLTQTLARRRRRVLRSLHLRRRHRSLWQKLRAAVSLPFQMVLRYLNKKVFDPIGDTSTAQWLSFWTVFMATLAMTYSLLWTLCKDDQFGFAILKSQLNWRNLQWWSIVCVSLPLNAVAQLVVFGSDYARRCLLAPPRDSTYNPDGKVYYQSLAALKATTWSRKLLWLTLSITSLPIHILYNSAVQTTVPANDAYEVVVDESFFYGQPFNLTSLYATQFEDQAGAVLPYRTPFPDRWPGIPQLQTLLEDVQHNASAWKNLSNHDCRSNYGLDIYSEYRTLIKVTNSTDLPRGDSVHAIGALPGITVAGTPNRFMALCPRSYVDANKNITWPTTTSYVATVDIPPCTNSIAGDCGHPPYLPHGLGPTGRQIQLESRHDLCRMYRNFDNLTLRHDTAPALPLSYCLSEPIQFEDAQLVWSRSITAISAVVLSIKAAAMLATYYCIKRDDGFADGYPWNDMSEEDVIALITYIICHIVITFYNFVNTGFPDTFFESGATPRHEKDTGWIYGVLIQQNWIHGVMVVREYIEGNTINRSDGLSRGKPRLWIPLPMIVYLYNLAIHQLLSFWQATAMVERFGLDAYSSAKPTPIPTIIRDNILTSHTGPNIFPSKFEEVDISFSKAGRNGILCLAVLVLGPMAHTGTVCALYGLFNKRGLPELSVEDAAMDDAYSDYEDEDSIARDDDVWADYDDQASEDGASTTEVIALRELPTPSTGAEDEMQQAT